MELKLKVKNIEDVNTRLDKFIFNEVEKIEELTGYFSRTKLQTLIQNNLLMKNSVIFNVNSYKVQLKDEFVLILENEVELNLIPKDIPLNIVYEDNYVIVINKQAGLTTHPGAGNYTDTLVNTLLFYCKDNLSKVGGFLRPGIVHRLDKDTSGLMIVAKNDFAHNILSEQLQKRELKRTYNAIIWGNMFPPEGKIEGYINRSKNNRVKMEMSHIGKYSLTNYKTLETYSNIASLIECKLDTGRTHQIRVHFSHKKHPLIGDPIYCNFCKELVYEDKQEIADYINNFKRQALHSKSIRFIHPYTKEEMFFESELAGDIQKLNDSFKILLNSHKQA